jgi:hypothetical protein
LSSLILGEPHPTNGEEGIKLLKKEKSVHSQLPRAFGKFESF